MGSLADFPGNESSRLDDRYNNKPLRVSQGFHQLSLKSNNACVIKARKAKAYKSTSSLPQRR